MPRKKLTDEELSANRDAIRRVAASLFSRFGFEAVTMRSIAKELGWSPMATYKYFENKDAIFMAIREDALHGLAATMQRSALDGGEGLERIYLLSRAYVRYGIENIHEYRLVFEYYSDAMPGFPIMTKNSVSSWELLFAAIQDACTQGLLVGDANRISHILWTVLHGLVSLQNSKRYLFGLTAKDITKDAIDAVLSGFSV